MNTLRTALAATGLAVVAAAGATAPIAAETIEHEWTWSTSSSHDNLAFGSYDDDSGTLRVDDREQDGHSVYVYVDGPWTNNTTYWDNDGAVGSGSYFDLTDEYDRGDYVEVYLCTGNWDTKEEVDCSSMKEGFTV